ncbi:MAG: FAD-dependent monooxygenase, partial [Chloroflexi bacterium]|nr:FAD-dependent monooxygenase [Chloroflexota bacterium]
MAADADVIVVGGGPAGAATGALLARRGHDVLLIDKSAFPREKACAEYYSPGAVDALERLGVLGSVEAARPARPGGMRIVAGETAFVLTYPDGSRRRSALSIPRGVLDRILLDHAEANGVRVVERVRALAALVENRRVAGVVARVAGVTKELRSRFVVAADGLHSTIARSLDLEAPTLWPRRLGLV